MTQSAQDARLQQLRAWLTSTLDSDRYELETLLGDASARRYHRVRLLDDQLADARYIVMDSADEQDAMATFINVATLMAPAINVPSLIAHDLSQGLLLLQDFGTVEFAHLLPQASIDQINQYYEAAMQTLIRLQQIDVDQARTDFDLPDYDTAMLSREMDLFQDWFLPYIGVSIEPSLWQAIKTGVCDAVQAQPTVVVHRDYHSRNLMQDQAAVNAKQLSIGVIDFQDAVVGAYSYDLVSLVRDAYVDWSAPQVQAWIHQFWQMQRQAAIPTTTSAAEFEADVNIMGVQRHLKVLGIFVRLSQRDGKDRYLADIPKVMRDLRDELDWLESQGNANLQQVITPFNDWLQAQVLPAYRRKFG